MGECMSVTIQTSAKPVASADRFAPPRASLVMPKQVLTAPSGSFLGALRSAIWAVVAPGLRRLG